MVRSKRKSSKGCIVPLGLRPLVYFANRIVPSDARPRTSRGIMRRKYSIRAIPYSNARTLIGRMTLTPKLQRAAASPAG